eukprot:12186243-Karenia_brevis.AAC.1
MAFRTGIAGNKCRHILRTAKWKWLKAMTCVHAIYATMPSTKLTYLPTMICFKFAHTHDIATPALGAVM